MENPVILSAVRTPIGKFMGGLSPLTAPELGAKVVAESVRRAGIDPKQVDEAIMGNVVQAGLGQNPARQAALRGGLDSRVAAMTINKVCGSGLQAVGLAAQGVILGESEIVVAGGMESMSNCPYLLKGARTGFRLGNQDLVDSRSNDGLWDVYENFHMGVTGELVAEKYNISRQEQDQFAYESHKKAVRAIKSCFFGEQIVPVEIPQKKGDPVIIKTDESPREDTTLEALAKLKPAFKKDGPVRSRRKTSRQNRLGSRQRCRPRRTQRSFLRRRHRRHAPASPQSRKSKCEWRRSRAWPSHRSVRRPRPCDAALRIAASQSETRHRCALPRRRQRRRPRRRALLSAFLTQPIACHHVIRTTSQFVSGGC